MEKVYPSTEDREKDDESEYTWSDWSRRVLTSICQRHKNATTIACVNDCYDDDIVNIKDSEHAKRSGSSDATFIGGSRNIYPRKNKKFLAAREFNQMFANKGNKQRIQVFLKEEFASLSKQENVRVIYSVRDKCEDISVSSHHRINEYECYHSEADTILLYIYARMRESGIAEDIVIDA